MLLNNVEIEAVKCEKDSCAHEAGKNQIILTDMGLGVVCVKVHEGLTPQDVVENLANTLSVLVKKFCIDRDERRKLYQELQEVYFKEEEENES